MFPPKLNKNGLTLVELLISTSIVGMIMVGMVSIDYALRSSERRQSRSALVSLRTTAMMDGIINDASQAFGSTASRCIKIGSTDVSNNVQTNNTNYICINQDSRNTPSDVTDDTWICYTRHTTNLYRCSFAFLVNPRDCPSGFGTLIGTVTTDTFNGADVPVFVSDSTTLDRYFQITLKNRFDPTTADYATAVAQEYLTNPKIKLTSKVSPAGCVE